MSQTSAFSFAHYSPKSVQSRRHISKCHREEIINAGDNIKVTEVVVGVGEVLIVEVEEVEGEEEEE